MMEGNCGKCKKGISKRELEEKKEEKKSVTTVAGSITLYHQSSDH